MEEQYKKDAEDLKNAMDVFGTDEDAIINIASKRTLQERLKIKKLYKSMFGRDLISDLKSELSGKLEEALIASFTDILEYDTTCINNAIAGLGTDEDALIEIIGSRPNWYLNKIKIKYKEKYNTDLEKDIIGDTSGIFQKILISLLQCNRKENQESNLEECENIAKDLFKIEDEKIKIGESEFIKCLTICSSNELIEIAKYYNKLTNNLLTEGIDKLFSSDAKKLLKTILYANISPSEYFAFRIHQAIDAVLTDNKSLIRVIIGRSDIDIPAIKQYYKQLYNKDLVEDVKKNISGDYKKLMVAMLTREII